MNSWCLQDALSAVDPPANGDSCSGREQGGDLWQMLARARPCRASTHIIAGNIHRRIAYECKDNIMMKPYTRLAEVVVLVYRVWSPPTSHCTVVLYA